MVTVFRHGDKRAVENPANRAQVTNMVNVTFMEEGRQGLNRSVSDTSKLLDMLLADELGEGETTGLNQIRIHTQPVRYDQLKRFPIGRKFDNAFINRSLHSVPQIDQQVGVKPRMVDSKPTFVLTTMDSTPKDDADNRMSNEILAGIHPEYFEEDGSIHQAARTTTLERASQDDQQADMNQVMAERPLANLTLEEE